MSIAGYPMDHGEGDRHDDGRATPTGGPPDDWDAQFTAIVSGISGSMRWQATPSELDDHAADVAESAPGYLRAPDSIWQNAAPDTADDRRLRRELRRAERAEELAAFQRAQEEVAAARAADTEHYEPPPPPPLPRPSRRTVGAIALMVIGLVLVIFPALLPAPYELIAVVGLGMLFGGGAMMIARMRRHPRHDDGAQV